LTLDIVQNAVYTDHMMKEIVMNSEDVESLVDEITRLRAEVQEQARLLDVSAALEVKLRNRIELLEWAMVNTPQAM